MKIVKATIYSVPLRGESIGVISPAEPLKRLFVSCLANGDWYVIGGRTALTRLARLAMVAAHHDRSIVYVPTARAQRPRFLPGSFLQHDLVMVHHSLQLPASAWKGMRRHLKDGKPKTLEVQAPDRDYDLRLKPHMGSKDVFDLAAHSRTVFLVGSQILFRHLSGSFASLATCTESGDHSHLFELARGQHIGGQVDDLTMMYCSASDWV